MNRDQVFDFIHTECEKMPPDRQHYFKHSGDCWICCPYHSGGQENTPSFKINLDPRAPVPPGQFYCFGCKTKGDWNTLAELFDLRSIRKSQMQEASADDAYLKRRFISLDDAQVPDLRQMAPWSPDVDWRNIPGHVVNRYYGRSTAFGKKAILYLPVFVYGEHVGGIQAVLVRDRNERWARNGKNWRLQKQKAYINTSGDWSHSALFGYDQAVEMRSEPLWVVEGPRDTMWINANGGRAVGLIGSAVTEAKINLIRDLDPPCLLIATDPDDAGEIAADRLFEAFENEMPVHQFPFKADTDAAELKPRVIERAIEKMRAVA